MTRYPRGVGVAENRQLVTAVLYASAALSGDLAGHARPISTSVTVMGERHSEDKRRRLG
jgi:hypothetical protein